MDPAGCGGDVLYALHVDRGGSWEFVSNSCLWGNGVGCCLKCLFFWNALRSSAFTTMLGLLLPTPSPITHRRLNYVLDICQQDVIGAGMVQDAIQSKAPAGSTFPAVLVIAHHSDHGQLAIHPPLPPTLRLFDGVAHHSYHLGAVVRYMGTGGHGHYVAWCRGQQG